MTNRPFYLARWIVLVAAALAVGASLPAFADPLLDLEFDGNEKCRALPNAQLTVPMGSGTTAVRPDLTTCNEYVKQYATPLVGGVAEFFNLFIFPGAGALVPESFSGKIDEIKHFFEDEQNKFDAGWGTTGAIFFDLQREIDVGTLPTGSPDVKNDKSPDQAYLDDLWKTVVPVGYGDPDEPSAFLINLNWGSPHYLELTPVITGYRKDWACQAVLYCNAPPNETLALVPLQGVPLEPNAIYAAVLTNRIRGKDGEFFSRDPSLACLDDPASCDGGSGRPAGISPHAHSLFAHAVNRLKTDSGPMYNGPTAWSSVIALTAFRTGDPTAAAQRVFETAMALPSSEIEIVGGGAALTRHAPYFSGHPSGDTDHGAGGPGGDVGTFGYDGAGTFGEFCVYSGEVKIPNFTGNFAGKWRWNKGLTSYSTPATLFDPPRIETARIVVTIPRVEMPETGFPVAVVSRAGMAYDTDVPRNVIPLVEHGTSGQGGWLPRIGEGPALHLARAGYAAVQFDDLKNATRMNLAEGTNDYEASAENNQYFNIQNVPGIPSAIAQAGLEQALVAARVLETIFIDASACLVYDKAISVDFDTGIAPFESALPNAGSSPTSGALDRKLNGAALTARTNFPDEIHFDMDKVAYLGQSVGAHIAPVALAQEYPVGHPRAGEPIFKTAIVTGATGSMLNTVLYKNYLHINSLAHAGLTGIRWVLGSTYVLAREIWGEQEPIASLFQIAQERAEPAVYNRIVAGRTRATGVFRQNVLQIQGLLDHEITPPIANTANLSLGLGTETVRAGGNSRDADPDLYDDRYYLLPGSGGEKRHVHKNGPMEADWSRSSDWSTHMPYDKVQGFAGWSNDPNATAALGGSDFGGMVDHFASGIPTSTAGRSLMIFSGEATEFLTGPGTDYVWDGSHDCTHAEDPDHARLRWRDGHEGLFQSSVTKQRYTCYLKGAALGEPIVVPQEPDDLSDEAVDEYYQTCCDHTPYKEGPALIASCSCVVDRVCADPNFSYCCGLGGEDWGAQCVEEALRLNSLDPRCSE